MDHRKKYFQRLTDIGKRIIKSKAFKKTASVFVCIVLVVLMCKVTLWTANTVYTGGWKAVYWEIFQGGDIDKLDTEYDEEWMIGKTRGEIMEKYGKFDEYSKHEGVYFVLYPSSKVSRIRLIMWFEGDQLNNDQICTSISREQGIPAGG